MPEIKRREVELDPQVSPEEIMSREVELGCKSWTSFTSGYSSTTVQQTLSLWLCPARQLKQQLRSALVAAQWRGATALTLPLFWQQSTVSLVFFGRYLRSSLHSLVLPPVPIPNKQPRFCGHKATFVKFEYQKTHQKRWKTLLFLDAKWFPKSGTLRHDQLILFVLMLNMHRCVQLARNPKNVKKYTSFLISLTLACFCFWENSHWKCNNSVSWMCCVHTCNEHKRHLLSWL